MFCAIILNQNGTVLDGYHRYRACQELGKDPKLQVKHFDGSFLEQKFRTEVNMNRRHSTPFQRIKLQYKLESIDAELVKERFDMHLPKEGQKGFQPVLVQKDTDIGINCDTNTERTCNDNCDKIAVHQIVIMGYLNYYLY